MLPLDRCYRALFYDDLEDYEEVIAGLTDFIAKNPGSVVALNNRGLAYSEIGNREAAERDFAAAIASDATEPSPLVNWGDLLRHAGDPAGALDKYKQAQVIAPDDVYLANQIAALS